MGVDPAGFSSDNIQSFDRYAYANNNPYAYVDPDGQAAVAVVVPAVLLVGGAIYVASGPEQQAQMGKLITWMGQNVKKNLQWAGAIGGVLTGPYFNESTSRPGDSTPSADDQVSGLTDGLSNEKDSRGQDRPGHYVDPNGDAQNALDSLSGTTTHSGQKILDDNSVAGVHVSKTTENKTLHINRPRGKRDVKIRYPKE